MKISFKKSYQSAALALTLVMLPLALVRCGDTFMKQKVTNDAKGTFQLAATADAAGNYTGAIDPNSTATQVLRAGAGDLAGSAISLPPGALGINLNITIGSGETLASSDTSQQLGLGSNSTTAAGPAVSFVPSQNVQATNPFTLSIPVSSTSLALADSNSTNDNLIVMYKWMKVDNGVPSYSIGIITRDQLTIGSKAVQFQTDKFGTFQLAVSQTKITQPINIPTAEPPVLKADASNPLVGVWSQCYANSNQGGYKGQNTSTANNGPLPSPMPIPDAPPNQLVVNPIAQSSAYSTTFSASGSIYASIEAPQDKTNTSYTLSISKNGSAIVGSAQILLGSGGYPQAVSSHSYSYATAVTYSAGDTISLKLSPNCSFGASGGSYSPFGAKDVYYQPSQSMISAAQYIFCNDRVYSDWINYVSNYPGIKQTALDFNANLQKMANGSSSGSSGNNSSNGGGDKNHLGVPSDAVTSSKEFVKFSANTFIHSRSLFPTSDCTGGMISRSEETGSYKLGAVGADTTYPISITFATNMGAIMAPPAVDFANSHSIGAGCGISDWVANVSRDLSRTICASKDDSKSGPSKVKIQNDRIYFDDGGSGTVNTSQFMIRSQ